MMSQQSTNLDDLHQFHPARGTFCPATACRRIQEIPPDFAAPWPPDMLAFGKAAQAEMCRQLSGASRLRADGLSIPDIARSGQLDALIAVEAIATRLRFLRNQEIYSQGEGDGSWYKVISGTVRISKRRTDGRRHIAEFCFSGDGFGLESAAERSFSAEAVGDVSVMRYPRAATERLTEETPAVARLDCCVT